MHESTGEMGPNSVTSSLQSPMQMFPKMRHLNSDDPVEHGLACLHCGILKLCWNLFVFSFLFYPHLFIYFYSLCLGWLMLSHRSSGADKQGEAMALSRACIQTAPKSQRIWWRSKWNHATSNRKEGGIWANQPCLRCVSASAELERAVCRHHHLQLKNVASADELGWWWLGKWWGWWW